MSRSPFLHSPMDRGDRNIRPSGTSGMGGWQKPGVQPAANPTFLHREQIKHSLPQSTAKPDTPGATLQGAKPFSKQPSCPSILPAAEQALHSPEQPEIWLPVFWGITSFVRQLGTPAFPRKPGKQHGIPRRCCPGQRESSRLSQCPRAMQLMQVGEPGPEQPEPFYLEP